MPTHAAMRIKHLRKKLDNVTATSSPATDYWSAEAEIDAKAIVIEKLREELKAANLCVHQMEEEVLKYQHQIENLENRMAAVEAAISNMPTVSVEAVLSTPPPRRKRRPAERVEVLISTIIEAMKGEEDTRIQIKQRAGGTIHGARAAMGQYAGFADYRTGYSVGHIANLIGWKIDSEGARGKLNYALKVAVSTGRLAKKYPGFSLTLED
jgi:hypothetical protein